MRGSGLERWVIVVSAGATLIAALAQLIEVITQRTPHRRVWDVGTFGVSAQLNNPLDSMRDVVADSARG